MIPLGSLLGMSNYLWNEHFSQRSVKEGPSKVGYDEIVKSFTLISLFWISWIYIFFCWQSKEIFMSRADGSFAHQVWQQNTIKYSSFAHFSCIINDWSNLKLHHISRIVLHMPFSIHTHSGRKRVIEGVRHYTHVSSIYFLSPVYWSLPKKGGIPLFWGAWV